MPDRMKILILSTSLNPESRSRVLARRAEEVCRAAGVDTCLVDLQELSLPFCDGADAGEHPQVPPLLERVREADGVLIAAPIYTYGVNAACKNFVELTGEAWENKIVGFLCAAGGRNAYMGVMGFANGLMLDFRCLIVPRFVYATGAAFRDGALADPEVDKRVNELCAETLRLAEAVGGVR
jgi:FMN reductase